MKIKITTIFEKTTKKLHRGQIRRVEDAIDEIAAKISRLTMFANKLVSWYDNVEFDAAKCRNGRAS